MALSDKFKTLVRKLGARDLDDPVRREQHIRDTIERARNGNGGGGVELVRQLDHLGEVFEERGHDALEPFRVALRACPDSDEVQAAFGDRLMKLPTIGEEDLPALRQAAERQGRHLSLWRRLLEERRRLADAFQLSHDQDAFVLCMLEYFPAPKTSHWFDVDTEREARSLFRTHFESCLNRVMDEDRADKAAERILRAGAAYFPSSSEIASRSAQVSRAHGSREEGSLENALKALLLEPDDPDMMAFAGQMLAERRGHEEEGLAMMRRAREAITDDPELDSALARAALRSGSIEEPDVPAVETYLDANPGDAIAAGALSDIYAGTSVVSHRAAATHEMAVAERGDEGLLRAAGVFLALGLWDDCGRVLEQVSGPGRKDASYLRLLAVTCGNQGRTDAEAVAIYREAFEAGERDPAILDPLARGAWPGNGGDGDTGLLRELEDAGCHSFWVLLGRVHRLNQQGETECAFDEGAALEAAIPVEDSEARGAWIAEMAEALSHSFRRPQLRRLRRFRLENAREIIAAAHHKQPDALPLLRERVEVRLKSQLRDEETVELLAELCRREPDEYRWRLERADCLLEVGEVATAFQLYRDLLDSMADSPGSSDIGGREAILRKWAQAALHTAGTHPESRAAIASLAADPAVPPDFLVEVAEELVHRTDERQAFAAVLERAHAVDPDNDAIHFAVAILRAERGAPRTAFVLALDRLLDRAFTDDTLDLLRAAQPQLSASDIDGRAADRLDRLGRMARQMPGEAVVLLARIIGLCENWKHAYEPLLARAATIEADDEGLREILEKCRAALR